MHKGEGGPRCNKSTWTICRQEPRALTGLRDGEEIQLVQGGIVVGLLRASTPAPPPTPPGETDMAEVMEHFGAIIEDEF